MNNFLKSISFAVLLYLVSSASVLAQNLKLDELNTCFTAKNYPDCLFEMVEAKGFYRVDKQYLENCDRVIYTFVKNDRPVMFVNPVLCPKPQQSSILAKRVKNELELQFQKNGRGLFEQLSAQIRKTCKPVAVENGTVPEGKSKIKKRAYRNETTGITYVVINTAPVAYIYFLK